jgi:hypothetical protein
MGSPHTIHHHTLGLNTSRSIDPLVGWQRNCFEADLFGTPTERPAGTVNSRTPFGHELPVSDLIWQSALQATAHGLKPNLHEVLIQDAHYHAATGEYRRLVLDAANACENLKERVFETLWVNTNQGAYRRGKVLSGYDLPKHLDMDIKQLCGRSFKQEVPTAYVEVKRLWDARGNVAHGEDAFYREDNRRIDVSEQNANDLVKGAAACLEWLAALIRGNLTTAGKRRLTVLRCTPGFYGA